MAGAYLPSYEGAVAPLAITSVGLRTETNLSDEARNAIANKIIAKYGITNADRIKSIKLGNEVSIGGPGFAWLRINLNNDSRIITYDYGERADLDSYYQNLLTKLAEEAAKKQPDGINGL